jgi:hypothetical protein
MHAPGILCFALLATVSVSVKAFAQNQAPPEGGRPRNFQGRGDGPWNHRVLLAASDDGTAWSVGGAVLAERASVPALFLDRKGRPVLLFVDASGASRPGTLGALARQPDGSWKRRETNLRGADPDVVQLKDGRYRAFTKERDSAIMAFSSWDGLEWERIGPAFQDDRYAEATDPDVFETPHGWVALLSVGPRLLRCTSGDGLEFTSDGTLLDLGGSVSNTVAVEGGWRTFFHVNENPGTGRKRVIRSAFTADGRTWKVEEGDRVAPPPSGPASLGVGDPAPVRMPDGTWLMAVGSFIERPGSGPPLGQDVSQPQPQNPNRDGPWNNDVVAYRVTRGGAVEKVATFERAGVPTVARMKDDRLIVAHQHFPENDRENFDKVAVHFSSDEGGTWTAPQVIRVEGLPDGMRFPFDPTLVPLPDGRMRLYFTGNMGRNFGRSSPKIHSAVSTDGVNYTFEPGVRFEVAGKMTIDCAVAWHDGVYHLFVPHNGAPPEPGQRPAEASGEGLGFHATSSDGLSFTRQPDVQIEGRRRWLGNAQSDGGQIVFFGTGEGFSNDAGERPRGGIWMGTSTDGKSWNLVSNPAVGGADPGAVRTREGGWLIVVTGPPARGGARREGGGARPNGADVPPSADHPTPQRPPPVGAGSASNAANDFKPPVGRAEGSPRESPGHFRLLTARSRDGLTFEPTGDVISDQANVPDLIAGSGGAIHLYYSGWQVGNRENTLALALSHDEGRSWSFKQVEVDGGELGHAGDPDIVRLEDGTFRIFLTTMVNGRHGVVYCDSPDGIHFTKGGTAFAKSGLELLDSTTFRLGSVWHMLTLQGTGITQRHGTSADGREFSVGQMMPFVADGEGYIAANGVTVDGGYRIYGFSLRARNIRSFFSSDGESWTAESGVRLALDAKSSLGGAQIKDPSVLRLADGTYLMVYVARIPETEDAPAPALGAGGRD